MTEVVIREAFAEDAPAIANLLARFNEEFDANSRSETFFSDQLRTQLAGRDLFAFLADDAKDTENPIGFALITLRPSPYYLGPVALLEELYVVPTLRGQGTGSLLMSKIVGKCETIEAGELQINVDSDDIDARRFYERHGFSNTPANSDEQFLYYEKVLPAST